MLQLSGPAGPGGWVWVRPCPQARGPVRTALRWLVVLAGALLWPFPVNQCPWWTALLERLSIHVEQDQCFPSALSTATPTGDSGYRRTLPEVRMYVRLWVTLPE